jgi:hypothetical protein
VVAALLVAVVHRRRKRHVEMSDGTDLGQAPGVRADPGLSRPAGPDAETQAPQAGGNVGAPEEDGSGDRE